VSVEQLKRAGALVKIVSVQNRYNLGDRASEDVLQLCERDGLGFLPWYPVGAGDLDPAGGALDQVAKAHAVTPAQVAWPGCSSTRRSCFPSRAPPPSRISRRTWRRRR
jgi:aryl-alcohol dehydrogenase-like predicted oxidoreductase